MAGSGDRPGNGADDTTDGGVGHGLGEPPGRPSLIDYPSAFPIKVMGPAVDGFEAAMVELVRRFDAGFDAATVERRPSRGRNYLGLTLTVVL